MSANAEQERFWNEQGGKEWVALQDQLDRQLAPFGEATLEAAAARPGESVLDVGCGCGATTLALAATVGSTGRVLGLDISAPMAELARQRGAEAGYVHMEVEVGDAQDAPLPGGAFDLVFSRYGVMFFVDPVAAFANLLGATKPGGRLTFVCWSNPQENAWATVSGRALVAVLPPQPTLDPLAPGPFAFADSARVRQVLTDAGWRDVDIAECRRIVQLGGTTVFEDAVDLSLRIGPTARALAGAENAELRPAARAAISDALRPYQTADGVMLEGVCWIVRAQR